MIGKIGISEQAKLQYRKPSAPLATHSESEVAAGHAVLRTAPDGVDGPLHFCSLITSPAASLPNRQAFVPYWLCWPGNTVFFNPKRTEPAQADGLESHGIRVCRHKRRLPDGVYLYPLMHRLCSVSICDSGKDLSAQPGLDGLFFNRQLRVGHRLPRTAWRPAGETFWRFWEMGGNQISV